MDGIKNIEISNFRGIEHLKIEDFARVNILVGQNNCGKSTVLEALLLITGMHNPYLPQNINAFRSRYIFNGVESLKYLFYNMDLFQMPHFFATQFDGDTRELSLTIGHKQTGGMEKSAAMLSTEATKFLNMVFLDFAVNGSKYNSYIVMDSTGTVSEQHFPEDYFEKINTILLSPDISTINLVNDLGEIIKLQQKSEVITLLKKFDDRINTLEVINEHVFLGLDGMNELIPLAMAGDGMKRYLNIIAAAANRKTNIILIDEIDNGLHYSAYKKLWQALFALAEASNKQIFVTTHSKETLFKLNEMLVEKPDYQASLRLYTLEKTLKKGLQAYKLTHEGLRGACENDIEIRSVVL